MKNKIWILVIVIVIVSLAGVSGAYTGIAINHFINSLNEVAIQPYNEVDVFSMLDKMSISNDYLSGYSTLQEAMINLNKPIEISNVGFTSKEMNALLNINPEILESAFLRGVSFDILPDNSIQVGAYIDAALLSKKTNIPVVALSVIQNMELTMNTKIIGVSEDNKLIVTIDEIYIKDIPIMNFLKTFPLGEELKGLVSEITGKEMQLDLPMFPKLKSFNISDNLAYIDGTYDYNGVTDD